MYGRMTCMYLVWRHDLYKTLHLMCIFSMSPVTWRETLLMKVVNRYEGDFHRLIYNIASRRGTLERSKRISGKRNM